MISVSRKKYTKPSVGFTQLTMNAALSTGCAMEITFAEFFCPVLIPEWGETVYQEHNCDWSNDDFYICYHVPTLATNVFSS